MSRLKAKIRYALLAALDLAAHYDGEKPVKSQEIAIRTGIPSNYLVHILLSLKRRALVNSTRGPKGGYWLLRPPARITVAEVMDAVEPTKHPGWAAESDCERLVNWLWTEAQNRQRQYFAGLTLADALRAKPK